MQFKDCNYCTKISQEKIVKHPDIHPFLYIFATIL